MPLGQQQCAACAHLSPLVSSRTQQKQTCGAEYKKRPKRYKGTRGGEAIQFGAARDNQTAADTAQLSGHVSTGACTFAFIQAIERAGTHISYGELLRVRPALSCMCTCNSASSRSR